MWKHPFPPPPQMSEEERQKSLARARKKLREFQERNNLLPKETIKKKKKIRHASSHLNNSIATSEGCHPHVEVNKAAANVTTTDVSYKKVPSCDDTIIDMTGIKIENSEVLQPSPLVNGDEVLSSADLKSLESRCQELSLSLDYSNIKNSELFQMIENLRQQNEDILNQMEKEKKDFEQKFAKEQGALRAQLHVHIQTIGILVSEKSDLQTALGHTQQAVRRKEGEAEELATKLHTSRLRVMELERTLSAAASRQKRAEKDNKELSQERDSLKMKLYKNNKNNEDLKQLNSELEEKLRICVKEKATLQLGLDDVKKQLEMSELLLLQYSSPSEVATDNQQFQQALEVRTHLEKEVEQLKMLLKNLQIDRDNYAQRLNNEMSFWQGKMQQLLDQMTTLKEEKEKSMNKVEELETYVTELKSQMAVPSPPEPPQGPSEMEQRLQTKTEQLQKKLEDLAARLEEQVKNNELNQSNLVQGCRLAELEQEAEIWGDQAETRKTILETMENDRTTISRAMLQNQQLKEQLAELQDGFIKLVNKKTQEAANLQQQQNQCRNHSCMPFFYKAYENSQVKILVI
ncbi:golgin subfamily A member 2 [Erinaceus europaeus]|uniref:Golgin subfamily A member 2 n=1 Tax=Erinaceus europaeus TaxID=9365 RepID=A0ABM3Y595_ERIEU|nr:golgin subfamily A member 2 [Erinaceus europaeus]